MHIITMVLLTMMSKRFEYDAEGFSGGTPRRQLGLTQYVLPIRSPVGFDIGVNVTISLQTPSIH